MKLTLFSVTFLLLARLTADAQWQIDNSFQTSSNLSSITALTEQDRFLIECDVFQSSWSSNGLYKTTNGGAQWDGSIGSELCPATIFFVNSSVGYLVTSGSAIGAAAMWKTTDGANTWSTINFSFPTTQQKGLFFVDENIGYYGSGDGFHIHKTTDGGASWTVKNIGVNNAVIDAIHFFNKDEGIIAGWYGPKIAKTVDGGDTWTDVSTSYGVYGMHFPSQTTGYAVGADASNTPVIIKTVDAGNTWQLVYDRKTPNKQFFFSAIRCLDDKTCFAVGDSGTILKTTDGGNTWYTEPSGTFERLNSISCAINRVCFAVGNAGVMLKNTSGTNVAAVVDKQNSVTIYPNPFSANATIQFAEKINNGAMNLYNSHDQLVRRYSNITGDQFSLHRQQLSPGLYFFTLWDGDKTLGGKFVIE